MGLQNVFAVQAMMSLVDHVTGPLQRIRGRMGDAGREADSLGTKMGRLARAMAPVALAAGLVVGGFSACIGATLETQAALGELASVGIRDMDALSRAAEEFSGTWAGTTKPQFIAAAYDIKSGIASLTDAGVAEFTKLAALTGKATKSSTAEMTSLFATGYGIYKGMYGELSDMQFGEVFSAGIAASVQAFKTSGSGMAQAISSLGATATSARVPLEEQLSVLGMLQATMSGGEAGTKYKALMQSAAGAGEKLGLQFMDSNNQLLSLPDILGELKGKYGDTLDAMEKMEIQKAFGTSEAVAVIDLLYGKVDDLSGSIAQMGSAMQQGEGFTTAMADAMNRDLGAVMELNRQKFHNLAETIGTVFLPIVTPVAMAIGRVVDVLSALARTSAGKALMLIVGGVAVAALGVTAFAAAWSALGAVVPFVLSALAPLGAAVAAISWPVWVVVGAVALLALAWKTNFGGMADTLAGWWRKIQLVVQGVRAVFATLSGTVGTIEGQLATDIKAAGLVGLVTTVAKVAYRIKELFSGIWDGFTSATEGMMEIVRPVVDSLSFAFQAAGRAIAMVGAALFGAAGATEASGWRTLGAVVGGVLGGAFRLLAWAIRIALTPLSMAATLAGWVLSAFVGLGAGIGRVAGWIRASLGAVANVIAGIAGGVIGAARMMLEGVKWAFLNLTPVGWMIQAFSGITGFLEGLDLSEAGAKLIRTFMDGIKSMIMAPVNLVKGGLQKIRNLLPFSDAKEGPLSTLTLSGERMMETMAAGVRNAAPALRSAALGAVAGIAAVTAVDAGPMPEAVGAASWQGQEIAAPVEVKVIKDIKVINDLNGGSPLQQAGDPLPAFEAPVAPDALGMAAWQNQDIAAPVAPDALGMAAWQNQDIAAPGVPDAAPVPAAPAVGRSPSPSGKSTGERTGGQERKTVIQQLTVNLPNVSDGDGFIKALQAFVEAHHG